MREIWFEFCTLISWVLALCVSIGCFSSQTATFNILQFEMSTLQQRLAPYTDTKTNTSVTLAQLQSDELGYRYEFGVSGHCTLKSNGTSCVYHFADIISVWDAIFADPHNPIHNASLIAAWTAATPYGLAPIKTSSTNFLKAADALLLISLILTPLRMFVAIPNSGITTRNHYLYLNYLDILMHIVILVAWILVCVSNSAVFDFSALGLIFLIVSLVFKIMGDIELFTACCVGARNAAVADAQTRKGHSLHGVYNSIIASGNRAGDY